MNVNYEDRWMLRPSWFLPWRIQEILRVLPWWWTCSALTRGPLLKSNMFIINLDSLVNQVTPMTQLKWIDCHFNWLIGG